MRTSAVVREAAALASRIPAVRPRGLVAAAPDAPGSQGMGAFARSFHGGKELGQCLDEETARGCSGCAWHDAGMRLLLKIFFRGLAAILPLALTGWLAY